jgi:hypothetical protein
MNILVKRSRLSYEYKRYKSRPGSWANNDYNNSLDTFQLFIEDKLAFEASCQSVANMEGLSPGCMFNHTIKPGPFAIKLFVDRRRFNCAIHGIIRAYDFNNEYIDDNSVTPSCKERMLVHDWQSLKPKPAGLDTRVAWSDGCIILKDEDLVTLNKFFRSSGLNKDDIVECELMEVD